MSYYKDFDHEYLAKRAYVKNYDDPKWLAIEELEKRIEKLESNPKEEVTAPSSGGTPQGAPEAWKEDQATDKQKAFMVSKSIPFQEPISKGEASEKIDRYINAKQKAR